MRRGLTQRRSNDGSRPLALGAQRAGHRPARPAAKERGMPDVLRHPRDLPAVPAPAGPHRNSPPDRTGSRQRSVAHPVPRQPHWQRDQVRRPGGDAPRAGLVGDAGRQRAAVRAVRRHQDRAGCPREDLSHLLPTGPQLPRHGYRAGRGAKGGGTHGRPDRARIDAGGSAAPFISNWPGHLELQPARGRAGPRSGAPTTLKSWAATAPQMFGPQSQIFGLFQ